MCERSCQCAELTRSDVNRRIVTRHASAAFASRPDPPEAVDPVPTKVPKPLGGFYNRRPTRVRTVPDSPLSVCGRPACKRALLDPSRLFMVNGHPYLAIQKVGKGGSSKVYKVISTDLSVYALKLVDISQRRPGAVESFVNEIRLLRMLQGSERIIGLKESEVGPTTISIVLELGDIDLRGFIERNGTVDPNFLRLIWQQMLEAVQIAHDANVVHGDLKPANFLFVGGMLKLIDFGIAKAISFDTTNVERTNQTGTLNYMAPEALKKNAEQLKFKVGRAADVWSLGCILYQLVYNRPPFPQTDWLQRIEAIVGESYEIEFPTIAGRSDFDDLVDVMKRCLRRDPKQRPRIEELLRHRYVTFGKVNFWAVEQRLLSFVLMVQERCAEYDFEGEGPGGVVDELADQFRTGERIRLPVGAGRQRRKWDAEYCSEF